MYRVIRELGEGIEIGDNVGISQSCFIQVRGNVRIGSLRYHGSRSIYIFRKS